MTNSPTTLRSILSQQKPHIDCGEKGENTCRASWPNVDSVKLWLDFNLKNLNDEYGHLLDDRIHDLHQAFPQADKELRGIEIKQLGDTRHLMRWNDLLMRPTLDIAKPMFHHTEGLAISHAYTGQSSTVRIAGSNTPVDHIIALDAVPRQNLVVGLGRPSSRINVKSVVHNKRLLGLKEKEHFYVLGRLANLCRLADTPYGYIQTDQELVACHFQKSNNSNTYTAKVMPIPWASYGKKQLTTDLGLWYLCMKALSHSAELRVDAAEDSEDPEY